MREYADIIPFIKYKEGDKSIDEFEQKECSICFEAFHNGSNVRKIPTCKHIFHDACIMRWLSDNSQMEQQKCPVCNLVLSIDAIETAL